MKILLSLAVMAATCTAFAQGTSEAILDYANSPPVIATISGTGGWSFQSANAITVTELGCFAYVFDNLAVTSVQVGLWATNGSLLGSASITPSSILTNRTRYERIAEVSLNPGQPYRLGVHYEGGSIGLDVVIPSTGGTVFTSPGIQVGEAVFAATGFAYPANGTGSGGSIYAGPNFRFPNQGGVPEPSSCLLLCLGGLLLAVRRSRLRH